MRYSNNGKKQDINADTGEIKHHCVKQSLIHLLDKCNNFKEQNTDLEQLIDEISSNIICNITILFTPKSHC